MCARREGGARASIARAAQKEHAHASTCVRDVRTCAQSVEASGRRFPAALNEGLSFSCLPGEKAIVGLTVVRRVSRVTAPSYRRCRRASPPRWPAAPAYAVACARHRHSPQPSSLRQTTTYAKRLMCAEERVPSPRLFCARAHEKHTGLSTARALARASARCLAAAREPPGPVHKRGVRSGLQCSVDTGHGTFVQNRRAACAYEYLEDGRMPPPPTHPPTHIPPRSARARPSPRLRSAAPRRWNCPAPLARRLAAPQPRRSRRPPRTTPARMHH